MKRYILNLMAVLLVVTALSAVALYANSIYSSEGLAYLSDANDPNEPAPEATLNGSQIIYLTSDSEDQPDEEPEPEDDGDDEGVE